MAHVGGLGNVRLGGEREAVLLKRKESAAVGSDLQKRRTLLDVAVALVYLVVLSQPLLGAAPWIVAANVVTSVVIAAGMVLRWRWPIPAFGVVFALSLVRVLLGWSTDPFFAAAWVLYPVALTSFASERGTRLVNRVLIAVAVVILLCGQFSVESQDWIRFVLISGMLIGGSWALGGAVAEQRRQTRLAADARADAAVTQERMRIAREMHDVVSHTLSSIGVQAGVAGRVTIYDADELRARFRDIEKISRDALQDMKVALVAMRQASDVMGPPRPGITQLQDLGVRARAAGVDCTISVDRLNDLDEDSRLSVFRIVQESLTNVIRHAPGSRCSVRVKDSDHGVEIEVVDDGPGNQQSTGHVGHGLVGMRERVLSLGGSLSCGNRSEGGFRVHAVIPAAMAEKSGG